VFTKWPELQVLLFTLPVQVGSEFHVFLKVKWYKHVERDDRFKNMLRVRARGMRSAALIFEREEWVEAERLDGQVFFSKDLTLNDMGRQRYDLVHQKISSAYVVPDHYGLTFAG